jgi:hypothetical protein
LERVCQWVGNIWPIKLPIFRSLDFSLNVC